MKVEKCINATIALTRPIPYKYTYKHYSEFTGQLCNCHILLKTGETVKVYSNHKGKIMVAVNNKVQQVNNKRELETYLRDRNVI